MVKLRLAWWIEEAFSFTLPGPERLAWPGDRAAAWRWFEKAACDRPGFTVPRWRLIGC